MASALLALSVTTGVIVAGPAVQAGAQIVEVDPADFIDPVTGEFDTDAYLAALAAANNTSQGTTGGTGTLPITGSNSADVAAVGLALVAVGGAAVVASTRRRRLAMVNIDTDDVSTTTGN